MTVLHQVSDATLNRIVDENSDYAVKIESATFTWDSSEKPVPDDPKAKKGGFGGAGKNGQAGKRQRFGDRAKKPFRWIRNRKTGKVEVAQEMHAEIAAGKPGIAEAAGGETAAQPGLSPDAEAEADGEVEAVERVFQLKDVNLEIPRNCFIAVVGEIGSGKSSLLSALFGEMRRTEGKVMFGGSSASCSQVPWICNATVRENILFGRPFDGDQDDRSDDAGSCRDGHSHGVSKGVVQGVDILCQSIQDSSKRGGIVPRARSVHDPRDHAVMQGNTGSEDCQGLHNSHQEERKGRAETEKNVETFIERVRAVELILLPIYKPV